MELVAFPLGSRIPDAAALRARVETALAPLLAGTQLFSWFAVACGVLAVVVLVQRSLR